MKLTCQLEPDPDHRGMLVMHLQLEDDGEPLIDVRTTMPPELVEANLAMLTNTARRWWGEVTKGLYDDEQTRTQ
jgi:hypothetical protein